MKKVKKLKQGRGFHLFRTPLYLAGRETTSWGILGAAGVIAAFLILLTPIFYLSFSPPESEEPRPYVQHDQEAEKEKKAISVPDTFVGCGQQLYVCDSNNNRNQSQLEKENEFIKDKRDLNAQEGVWRASNTVASYAFIQAVLTAIGVYLLFRTLDATSKTVRLTRETLDQALKVSAISAETLDQARKTTTAANRAANETTIRNQIELQPYFRVKLVDLNVRTTPDMWDWLVIKLELINIGKTYASDVVVTFNDMKSQASGIDSTGVKVQYTLNFGLAETVFQDAILNDSTEEIVIRCPAYAENAKLPIQWTGFDLDDIQIRFSDFGCIDGKTHRRTRINFLRVEFDNGIISKQSQRFIGNDKRPNTESEHHEWLELGMKADDASAAK